MILTDRTDVNKNSSILYWDSNNSYDLKLQKVMVVNINQSLQIELEYHYHNNFELLFFNGKLCQQEILSFKKKHTSVILININDNLDDIFLIQNIMYTEIHFKVFAISQKFDEDKLQPIIEAGFSGWLIENNIKNNLKNAIESISQGNRFYYG